MKADKVTVSDLFDRQRRYAVPLYQRQYVWTQEAQWAPLWEDIAEKASQVDRGQARAPHFLGAIVTSQRHVFGNHISAWDIIDGQQRLTTLQIVLSAFRDVVTAGGEPMFDRDLQRLTTNEGVMGSQDERFKVWPTNADRPVFRAVMEAGSLTRVAQAYPAIRGRHKRPAPRIAEAYAYFCQRITQFVNGEVGDAGVAQPSQRISALFETFRRYLHIVNIELEADDDPQVIFESLNGRGVPLLPSDLVRNFVFLKADREGVDLDSLYSNYWRPYDEGDPTGSGQTGAWWKEEERQGRLKRPRLDLFLFHYLQYRLEREVNIGHLFQEFRNWWDSSSGMTTEQSLGEMLRNAKPFASWVVPGGSDRVAEFSRWLRDLDTSTVYPLLFGILVGKADKLPVAERDGILDDLESYLVRRTVCGLTIKQYNRFFLALLRNLQAEPELTRDGLRRLLMEGDGPSVRWPDDEEFGRAFVHRAAYRELKRPVLNRMLLALEQAMTTSKHEKILVVGDLSIEHVMPQAWEKCWEIADDSDETRERRDRLLHSFGNLTLVTPEFNTALSNRKFSDKQAELRKYGRLLLSKSFEPLADWNESRILFRGRELFDCARRRWPHPLSPASLVDLSLEPRAGTSWNAEPGEADAVVPLIDVASARALLARFVDVRGRLTIGGTATEGV